MTPLPPVLYLRQTLIRAAVGWLLLRLIFLVLALRADLPEPGSLPPLATLIMVALVPTVTWLDLRRRNLLVLLPNLGTSISALLAATALVAVLAELAVRLLL